MVLKFLSKIISNYRILIQLLNYETNYFITVFTAIFNKITIIGNDIANKKFPNDPPNSTDEVTIFLLFNNSSSFSNSSLVNLDIIDLVSIGA